MYDSTYPWTETTDPWPNTTVPLPTVPHATYDTTVPETTVPETTVPETTTVKWYRKEFEWRVAVTGHPKKGNAWTNWGNSLVLIQDSSNMAQVGTLYIHAEATVYPAKELTLTPSEQANGVPDSKTKNEIAFKCRGRTNYDATAINVLHPNDAWVPGPGGYPIF